jgi:Xaa-Pro dipeptidase
VAERLARRNLEAWFLVPGANLRYLTGIEAEPSERVFLVAMAGEGAAWAVVPQFEVERVRVALGPGSRVIGYRDETGPEPAMVRACGGLGPRTALLGAEFQAMRLLERAAVEAAVPRARWQPIDAECAVARQVKDAAEVAAIRRAAAAAREAAAAGVRAAAPGRREREVAAACAAVLHGHGTASPFPIAVASGPRAADPHAGTSDRTLEPGDVCWIDLGARVEGYCADVTRTVVVGGAPGDPELAAALEAVRAAAAAAVAAVRPGVTAEAVDAAAREVLDRAGFGARFLHRTGHGLGLEIHESPYLVLGNAEPLQPGMVFTVEPGAYFPGRGGVRIEDDILVTPDGSEVLTADR